jgi:protoporphyrinogen oxidase
VPDVLVLGGGITGLSLADALHRQGRTVCVLEAQEAFGGLVRTHEVGGHLFDTGPHGIYCADEWVQDWFAGLLGEALAPIERRSYTLFRGRRVVYPLTVGGALRVLRPWESARVMVEAGPLRALRGASAPGASFEEWAVRSFGATLYRLFFERYTEKVWGLPCRDLSAAWISVHLPANSLLQVLFNQLKKKDLPIGFVSRFHYSSQGSGHLVERLTERLSAGEGVELRAGARVSQLSHRDGRWTATIAESAGTVERTAPDVVSTIPAGVLLRLLSPAPPPEVVELARAVRFRNLVLVSLVIDQPRVSDANWLYVPDPAIEIARISEFKNMISSMRGRPDTSLQTETFCWPDDPLWSAPDAEVLARAVNGLSALGLVRADQVKASRVLRVPHAYPVFDRHYEARMRGIHAHLEGLGGLHLLGRTGAFLYLDQAGCVKQAFDWAREHPAACA